MKAIINRILSFCHILIAGIYQFDEKRPLCIKHSGRFDIYIRKKTRVFSASALNVSLSPSFCIFFKFMAANFSFAHFAIWVRPRYAISHCVFFIRACKQSFNSFFSLFAYFLICRRMAKYPILIPHNLSKYVDSRVLHNL